MKHLLFLTLICLLNANYMVAQNNTVKNIDNALFYCVYEYQINTKNKVGHPVKETYATILQVGNKLAKFWDYTAYEADSVILFSKASDKTKLEYQGKVRRTTYFFEPLIYQNYPAGEITTADVIIPDNYTYTQNMNMLEWTLETDTLTVCGNLCMKAKTFYAGKNWSVWYTANIPSVFGPWKLCGLPGLILQAEDEEKKHVFKAISIRKNSAPIYVDNNIQRIKTTKEKFIKNKNEFEKDPFSNIPPEAIGNMTVIRYGDGPGDKSALINGMQLRIKPNGYMPLETQ